MRQKCSTVCTPWEQSGAALQAGGSPAPQPHQDARTCGITASAGAWQLHNFQNAAQLWTSVEITASRAVAGRPGRMAAIAQQQHAQPCLRSCRSLAAEDSQVLDLGRGDELVSGLEGCHKQLARMAAGSPQLGNVPSACETFISCQGLEKHGRALPLPWAAQWRMAGQLVDPLQRARTSGSALHLRRAWPHARTCHYLQKAQIQLCAPTISVPLNGGRSRCEGTCRQGTLHGPGSRMCLAQRSAAQRSAVGHLGMQQPDPDSQCSTAAPDPAGNMDGQFEGWEHPAGAHPGCVCAGCTDSLCIKAQAPAG